METTFTNARVVLADEVLDTGTVAVDAQGRIHDVTRDNTMAPGAIDCEGDYLIPGLVELHTDNLEKHVTPRPKTEWPSLAAVIAHDAQMAVSGITTVFDAVALGTVEEFGVRLAQLDGMVCGITEARDKHLLRADHLLHLRCEISFPALKQIFDPLVTHPLLRLVSVMDHTPGQRQFVSEEQYRIYYQGKFGLSDQQMDEFTEARKRDHECYGEMHRQHVVSVCQENGISLASHDDATAEHVDAAVADGMCIAEFPTTLAAAGASHAAGLKVMMGAPNLVRGRSHSGNVSAGELAKNGVLDIISSDYIPSSLLHAAFKLHDETDSSDLPKVIRAVSKTPAEAAGLYDRGEISIGKRADLVRVKHTDHHPLIQGVWRESRRIA